MSLNGKPESEGPEETPSCETPRNTLSKQHKGRTAKRRHILLALESRFHVEMPLI